MDDSEIITKNGWEEKILIKPLKVAYSIAIATVTFNIISHICHTGCRASAL